MDIFNEKIPDNKNNKSLCSLVLKLSELHHLINTSPEPTRSQLGQKKSQ